MADQIAATSPILTATCVASYRKLKCSADLAAVRVPKSEAESKREVQPDYRWRWRLREGWAGGASGVCRCVFQVSLVIGYCLANMPGFMLMLKGLRLLLSDEDKASTHRELVKDIGVSLACSALIAALIKLGVLKLIEGYFRGN